MRHNILIIKDKEISVSIHASVKDATFLLCVQIKAYTVSIHASVKDATTIKDKRIIASITFQSTHL